MGEKPEASKRNSFFLVFNNRPKLEISSFCLSSSECQQKLQDNTRKFDHHQVEAEPQVQGQLG
jgi:hypothetical protein